MTDATFPRDVLATKRHYCGWCCEEISKGVVHKQWTVFDPDIYRIRVHMECYEALYALRGEDDEDLWGHALRGHTHESGYGRVPGCPGCEKEEDRANRLAAEIAESTWEINRAMRSAFGDENDPWSQATSDERTRQILWVKRLLLHEGDDDKLLRSAFSAEVLEQMNPRNDAKFRVFVEAVRQFERILRANV